MSLILYSNQNSKYSIYYKLKLNLSPLIYHKIPLNHLVKVHQANNHIQVPINKQVKIYKNKNKMIDLNKEE